MEQMEQAVKFYEPDLAREFTGLSVVEGEVVQVAFRDFAQTRGAQVAGRAHGIRDEIALINSETHPTTVRRGYQLRLMNELRELDDLQYQFAHTARVLGRSVGMLREDFYRGHLFPQYVGLPTKSAPLVLMALQSYRRTNGTARAAALVGLAERRLVALELTLDREARTHAAIRERLRTLCETLGGSAGADTLLAELSHGRAPVAPVLRDQAIERGLLFGSRAQEDAVFIDELTAGLAAARAMRMQRDRVFRVAPGQGTVDAPEIDLLDEIRTV
ncbi:MAG: hypothetical protein ACOYN3_09710, partial [Acidimicrobiia bacterium]